MIKFYSGYPGERERETGAAIHYRTDSEDSVCSYNATPPSQINMLPAAKQWQLIFYTQNKVPTIEIREPWMEPGGWDRTLLSATTYSVESPRDECQPENRQDLLPNGPLEPRRCLQEQQTFPWEPGAAYIQRKVFKMPDVITQRSSTWKTARQPPLPAQRCRSCPRPKRGVEIHLEVQPRLPDCRYHAPGPEGGRNANFTVLIKEFLLCSVQGGGPNSCQECSQEFDPHYIPREMANVVKQMLEHLIHRGRPQDVQPHEDELDKGGGNLGSPQQAHDVQELILRLIET